MRFIFRMIIMPVVLILSLFKLVLSGAAKLYCLLAGMAINLLIVCAVLALITRQWFALVVFGVIFLAIMAVLYSAGTMMVIVDNIKDKLLSE